MDPDTFPFCVARAISPDHIVAMQLQVFIVLWYLGIKIFLI